MDLGPRILDATRDILLQEGYEAISMRRIAHAVGVSATSLYLHFESKHALFEALVDEGMDLLHGRLSGAVKRRGDAQVDLDALCRAYLAFGLEYPEYYEIMFVVRPRDLPRFSPEKYRRARRNLDLLVDALRRLHPEASNEDVRVVASAIWASLHGAVSLINAHRLDRSISRDSLLEGVLALILPATFRAMPVPGELRSPLDQMSTGNRTYS